MARQIDLSQQLSEEDRAYLLARGREDLVLQNEAEHGNKAAEAALLTIPGTQVDRAPGVLGTPVGQFDTDPRRLAQSSQEPPPVNDPLTPADPAEALVGLTERLAGAATTGMGTGPTSFVDQNRPISLQSNAAQQGGEVESLAASAERQSREAVVAAQAAQVARETGLPPDEADPDQAEQLDQQAQQAQQASGDLLAEPVTPSEQEASSEEPDNYDDEAAWTFKDLREEAKNRELPAGGSREEIIARLRADDAEDDE